MELFTNLARSAEMHGSAVALIELPTPAAARDLRLAARWTFADVYALVNACRGVVRRARDGGDGDQPRPLALLLPRSAALAAAMLACAAEGVPWLA